MVLFLQLASVTSSVLTSLTIGVDRLWVIRYPLKSRHTSNRWKITISSIWLVAATLSSVQLIVGRVGDDGGCTEVWTNSRARMAYSLFILFFTYLLPLCILTFTYSMVGITLWTHKAPGCADEQRDLQVLKGKLRVCHFSENLNDNKSFRILIMQAPGIYLL